MTAPVATDVRFSPRLDAEWRAALAPLAATCTGVVDVQRGWDLGHERAAWRESAGAGREHLSVRVHGEEVQVGPRWTPGAGAIGCAGCAEARGRVVLDHPLLEDLATPTAVPAPPSPVFPEVLAAALAHLRVTPLRPGELYAVGTRGVRRHRVARSVHCPVCSAVPGEPAERPAPLVLRHRPVAPGDPTRAARGAALLDRDVLHRDLVDSRFGPVRAILREARAPFAMSMAVLPGAPALGHGRAPTFPETEPVAVLEAYERLGGFPFGAR
jgi:ribosomal protein S12 methylthiotransferase accessory factor